MAATRGISSGFDLRIFSKMGYFFALLLISQLSISVLIALTSHHSLLDRSGLTSYSYIVQNKRLLLDGNAAKQLQFVQNEASFIAQVYHDENFPVMKIPDDTWNGTIPLRLFCNSTGGQRPTYAVFRNVMLVGRELLLPASVNCRKMRRNIHLATVFHPGQNSTPIIGSRVVPGTDIFEDFEPHYSCHERVYEPSVLFSLINWPQKGHALFNGISLLWEAFHSDETGPLWQAGKNVRLYAYGDGLSKSNRLQWQQYLPFFELEGLQSMMSMFTHQPVRSLGALLMQSDRHPICFSYLLVGITGHLDHYNFKVPLQQWRSFARAVRDHYGVPESPRLNGGAPLHRLPPWEEHLNVNLTDLPDIRPIDWSKLPDRPRLVIIDRRENRVILNVHKLLETVKRIAFFKSSEIVYLEDINLEQQVSLIGETDVLFGMDGTGLMNGLFMPEGGIIVHVRPYGCAQYLPEKGLNFDRMWAAHPGRIIRHESGDVSTTRYPHNTTKELAESVFSNNMTSHARFPFIMKQDTVIDLHAFWCILDSAQKLLLGQHVDWELHNACTKTVFK